MPVYTKYSVCTYICTYILPTSSSVVERDSLSARDSSCSMASECSCCCRKYSCNIWRTWNINSTDGRLVGDEGTTPNKASQSMSNWMLIQRMACNLGSSNTSMQLAGQPLWYSYVTLVWHWDKFNSLMICRILYIHTMSSVCSQYVEVGCETLRPTQFETQTHPKLLIVTIYWSRLHGCRVSNNCQVNNGSVNALSPYC